MSRALLLEARGGLAFDLDVTCLRSWGPLLDEVEAIMIFEPLDGAGGGIYGMMPGDVNASSPIPEELGKFNSPNNILSSVMAASHAHTEFFQQLAIYTADFINSPHFILEANPVQNIGPEFHMGFLKKWFAAEPDISKGAALASYLA